MSYFTASDLSRYADVTGDPTDLMARYFAAALTQLNDATCNAIQYRETNRTLTSMVGADNITVRLPAWYSNITTVRADGREQFWSTTYDTGDIDPETGLIADAYTHIITLADPYPEGTSVTVTGDTGFANLPDSIKTLIANMIANLANRDNGTDLVTGKRIEDVSETINGRKATQSPLANLSDTYGPLLQQWSLCEYGRAVEGMISTPTKRHTLPWYVSEADVRGAYYVG